MNPCSRLNPGELFERPELQDPTLRPLVAAAST